jgi:hypothetical protein
MKTKILILAIICTAFGTQMQGQNRTIVNATSSEISDNLDLRVVASIFGDSDNLQDFERRLNDPKLQISNLDLNNDDEVDYLRVIESVENNTHVVIIQSVLDRDVYQDVATIEVEKDNYNQVHVQVVGNSYMYGPNYIYEPVYYSTPLIYASFWISNYRPYYSSWSWNYYPNYYYAWNPYPVFRYRNNVNYCLNNYYSHNAYNYVNYRRSNYAVNIYNTRRSDGYERLHPNYSFSRRNSNVNNRYDLDQQRNNRSVGVGSRVAYSQNRDQYQRTNTQRTVSPQRTETQRNYSQNRVESQRNVSPQRTETQRNYSQNRVESQRNVTPQRTDTQRNYSQNRIESQRTISPQRTETQRNYSQNRIESQRTVSPQRTETQRSTPSRNSNTQSSNSSRSSNRRS